MDRRTFIGMGAAGSIGIAGLYYTNSRSRSARTPSLSIEPDAVPDSLGADVEVIRREGFSNESPATIVVSVTNRESTARELLFGAYPPFTSFFPEGDDTAYLLPENGPQGPDEPIEGCWQVQNEGSVVQSQVAKAVTLAPDETIRNSYRLYSGTTTSGCFPTDSLYFKKNHYLGTDVAWGFTISIH